MCVLLRDGRDRKESCFPVELWCVDTLPASPGSELLTISRLLIYLLIVFLLLLVLGVTHIHSPGPWLFAWHMHDWVS